MVSHGICTQAIALKCLCYVLISFLCTLLFFRIVWVHGKNVCLLVKMLCHVVRALWLTTQVRRLKLERGNDITSVLIGRQFVIMSSPPFLLPTFIGPSILLFLFGPSPHKLSGFPTISLFASRFEYFTIKINMAFWLPFSDTWIVQSKPRFPLDVLCLMCRMNTLYITIRQVCLYVYKHLSHNKSRSFVTVSKSLFSLCLSSLVICSAWKPVWISVLSF